MFYIDLPQPSRSSQISPKIIVNCHDIMSVVDVCHQSLFWITYHNKALVSSPFIDENPGKICEDPGRLGKTDIEYSTSSTLLSCYYHATGVSASNMLSYHTVTFMVIP